MIPSDDLSNGISRTYYKTFYFWKQDSVKEFSVVISLKQDETLKIGRNSYLSKENEDKQQELFKVFDQHHYDICLPYQLNQSHVEKLKSIFCNILVNKFIQETQKQNVEAVVMRDRATSYHQTYILNNQVVELNEQDRFAFEKVSEKKKFSIENIEQDLKFIVARPDQVKINQNIFNYKYGENQNEEKQIKKFLYIAQFELEEIQNVLLINVDICDFQVLVYWNENNQYSLKGSDLDNKFKSNNLNQVELYEFILGQLTFEKKNQQWKLNCQKEECTFYQKVKRYPERFILRAAENIIARCKDGIIKIACNPL